MTDRFLPTTIALDGQTVPIRVTRFDFDTRTAFARDFDKLMTIYARSEALTRMALIKAGYSPKPVLEEASLDESPEALLARRARNLKALEAHVDDTTTALALRELEETPAQREKRDTLDAEQNAFAVRFTKETVERFISIDPSYELVADGVRVQSGADILRAYPQRQKLFADLIYIVHAQHTLSADLKKKLASPSGSETSSAASSATSPAVSGASPAPAAPSASITDSAAAVAATV